MAKSSKDSGRCPAPSVSPPKAYVKRQIAGTLPKDQFAPTSAMPVPQRYKMGGGA